LPLIGQPIVVSSVLVAMAVLLLTPLLVFVLLTIRVVEHERARLAVAHRRLQDRLSPLAADDIRRRVQVEINDVRERRVVDRQQLLPSRAACSGFLLVLDVTLLALGPTAIASDPKRATYAR
jgi:hypothetical protein